MTTKRQLIKELATVTRNLATERERSASYQASAERWRGYSAHDQGLTNEANNTAYVLRAALKEAESNLDAYHEAYHEVEAEAEEILNFTVNYEHALAALAERLGVADNYDSVDEFVADVLREEEARSNKAEAKARKERLNV